VIQAQTQAAELTPSAQGAPSRRNFLHLGCTLAAGTILPAGLYGCGGGGSGGASLPGETFTEPQLLESVNGLLDLTLILAYTTTTINGKAVTVRTMNSSIPAPTLRINAGDTLRIKVINQLPANPPSTEAAKHLRYPNSTNLHTHGLHVTPGLVSPGVYGDYVMDDPTLGIAPGQTRQHEYKIGADHPAGAYWYHPHLHGSTAIQVGSGMAGALMIKGAIDRVPEIAAARQRLFLFQAPITDASGKLESFADVASPSAEPPFLINGVRRPRLVMRSGEVQNWHFINAAISTFLNLSLDQHALHLYSHDGNTRPKLLTLAPDPVNGLVVAPGNRDSLLVQAGKPGTYYLRTLRYDMGNPTVLAEDILAEVVVLNEAMPMALPTGALPVPAALAPITDQELASGGGLKRNIVMRAVFNANGDPITAAPASTVVKPPAGELDDWQFQTGNTFMADTVFAMGSAGGQSSTNPGMPVEFAPFQSTSAQKQTVALGNVEEWTVYNMNAVQHPFHIHVNPFQVIKINGVAVDPFWADTIGLPVNGTPTSPTSVTFRTRFTDFKGSYVMHCHILSHEDMGMMQTIEIA
jgi:FtsP/CotA-like multicopper oxidase with cupredoxin domain